MARYAYNQLDSEQKEIRLLHLQPGRYGTPLKGTLRTVKLADKPKYDALSYTWGPITEDNCVNLDDTGTLPVSDNLYRALQRLRYQRRERVLWIDQICINQFDIDERSAQVASMGDIYASCVECAVWLGDVDDALTPRLPFATRLRLPQLWTKDTLFWSGKIALRDLISLCQPWFWSTAAALFSSKFYIMNMALKASSPSWIDRSWVRQEYCLSNRQCLYFGGCHLKPIPVVQMPRIIRERSRLDRTTQKFLQRLDTMRYIGDHKGDNGSSYGSLLPLVYAEPKLQVSDPKDKVYSLLSLLGAEERRCIRVDYSQPCAEVFARATFATMQGSTPGFICFNFVAHIAVPTSIDGLPTWAVDFSNLVVQRLYDYDMFKLPSAGPQIQANAAHIDSANPRCQPSIHIDSDWTILSINAVPLGFIEPSFPLDFDMGGDPDQEKSTLYGIANKIAGLFLHSRIAKDGPRHWALTRLGHIRQFVFGEQSQQHSYSVEQESDPSAPDARLSAFYEAARVLGRRSGDPLKYLIHVYCNYANDVCGGCRYFVTHSGHVGVGLRLLKRGDKLVYPTFDCEHDCGFEIAMHDFWYQPVIALRPQGKRWVFRGIVYLEDLENMDLFPSRVERFDIC